MVKERYTQTLQFYTDIIELNIQTSTDIKIPDAFVSELQNKDVYIAVFDSVGKSVYATTTVTDSLMCEVSKAALAVFNEKATNEITLIVRQEQSKKSYFYFGKKYGEQTVLASIPYHYITSDVWNIRNFTASFFMLFVLSLASMAFYLVSNKLLNTVKNLKKLIIKKL